LGQPVFVLEQMPSRELTEWMAWFTLKDKQRREAEAAEQAAQSYAEQINQGFV
jgi:cytosine/adenosine deaminase-related metal-dependent hydrolase